MTLHAHRPVSWRVAAMVGCDSPPCCRVPETSAEWCGTEPGVLRGGVAHAGRSARPERGSRIDHGQLRGHGRNTQRQGNDGGWPPARCGARARYDAVLAACVDRPLAQGRGEGARRAPPRHPPAAVDAGAASCRDQHHRRPDPGAGRAGAGGVRQRRPAPGRRARPRRLGTPGRTGPGCRPGGLRGRSRTATRAGWSRSWPPGRRGRRARRTTGRRQRAAPGGAGGETGTGDPCGAARHAHPLLAVRRGARRR